MAIDLRESQYIPTLFLRSAEMDAVGELTNKAKDTLTPIFCLKPWLASSTLAKAMARIDKAYPSRPFFLDIDPFASYDIKKRQAQYEFHALKVGEAGPRAWIDFFQEHSNAFPCIQVDGVDPGHIQEQIEAFSEQEKTFLIRLSYSRTKSLQDVLQQICSIDHSNFGIVVDMEWSPELSLRSPWADRIIKFVVDRRGDDIPLILSGSSFPNSFSSFSPGTLVQIQERSIYTYLQANNNQARVVYGDWASSRSPSEGGGGVEIPPRIDLPLRDRWQVFRVGVEQGGFPEAARRAVSSTTYPAKLRVWGTYMLEATALGEPTGIKSLQKATAVRINIHLHQQLLSQGTSGVIDTDEDYIE